MKNKDILQELELYFQWKKQTSRDYNSTLNNYSSFHNLTLHELIIEAEREENTINKVNHRTIKKRLIKYILFLQEEGKKPGTIKTQIAKIKRFYRYYDIDLPYIPPIRAKQKTEKYNELPSKEDIKNILLNVNLHMKAVITFLASSGLRISDLCNLTIHDFQEAVKEYTHSNELPAILYELEHTKMILIPRWVITSKKTDIEYITYTSDESTRLLTKYLQQRLLNNEIHPDDKLFDITISSLTKRFGRINDNLHLGYINGRRFFHAHALRKYFITSLFNDGVEFLTVDFLAGHTLPPLQASYYKANPDSLKKVYCEHMGVLVFLQENKTVKVDDVDFEELEELRRYKLETEKRLDELESLIRRVLE